MFRASSSTAMASLPDWLQRAVAGLDGEVLDPVHHVGGLLEGGVRRGEPAVAVVDVPAVLGVGGEPGAGLERLGRGGGIVGGAGDLVQRGGLVLQLGQPGLLGLQGPLGGCAHGQVCYPVQHVYLPTSPVRLIRTSRASSTAVMTRAAAW